MDDALQEHDNGSNDEHELDLSVVLPAHNEVGLLGSTVTNLVTGLEARCRSFELLIVENGSEDGTLRLARMLAAQIEQVRVLSLEKSDYGAALLAGFQAARAPYVVNFDVDYYDFAFLDQALAALEQTRAALVLASKRAPGSLDRRPFVRRAMTFGFTMLLKRLVGLATSDAHGMKVLDRRALEAVVSSCRLRASLFDVEMVVRAARLGLEILEVPATVSERRPPRSSPWRRVVESTIGALRLRRTLGPAAPAYQRVHLLDPTREPRIGRFLPRSDAAAGRRRGRKGLARRKGPA